MVSSSQLMRFLPIRSLPVSDGLTVCGSSVALAAGSSSGWCIHFANRLNMERLWWSLSMNMGVAFSVAKMRLVSARMYSLVNY